MTAYRYPWQNGYVEIVIGNINKECLEHVIILNESIRIGVKTDSLRIHYWFEQNKEQGQVTVVKQWLSEMSITTT